MSGKLVSQVLDNSRQCYAREWGRLDLIVVDYIGLMRPDQRQERREREVASITRALKLLAGELDCAVLMVSQMNREAFHREDSQPRLSDLRDSGAIEQDSDVVLFLHEGVVTIAKNRRGHPNLSARLQHRAEMTRFEEDRETNG